MHPDRAFVWDDDAAMLVAASELGWARIFAMTPAGPRVAHVAMLVDPTRGVLRFHLANNNAVTASLTEATVLALFEGPHAYVSASWYRDPPANVPTWNYVAIEVEGQAVALGREGLVALLDDLSAHNEAAVRGDWSMRAMDPRRLDAMLPAITAFELSIDAIRGTRKLSQNKSAAEIAALADGVERSGASEVAALMRAAP